MSLPEENARPALSPTKLRKLRGLAHHLRPVVMIGHAGASEGVLLELDRALEAHELIKVKLPALEGDERQTMIDTLCRASRASSIQRIGRTLVLYRPSED